jgi:RHS repeat-associated protein
LERHENEKTNSYTWDTNVLSAEETDGAHYYFQDDMGIPIRTLNADGIEQEVHGYDEFGNDLYQNREGIQPFGYMGYQKDNIANTYFAQAREYRPESGRFLSKDKAKYSEKKSLLTLNPYIYCEQDPLNFIDLNGHEVIIVSGGTADSDKFHYQFIETAIKNINDNMSEGVPKEDITWMVVDAGYAPKDVENFKVTASNLGINIEIVSDKNDTISYINSKDGGTSRANDQITEMSFFSHGQCPKYTHSSENQLSFAYGISALTEEDSANINFTQSDISDLDSNAFNHAGTVFYSCNVGTKDENGKSFAQEWSNKTGGKSYGIVNGRTFYAPINMAGTFGFHI